MSQLSQNPLISIIIPAYNHASYISETIHSVLNQSVNDFEIIIIDDGSTDNTQDIVKSIEDPRIQYYWQENQDAFNALNRGLTLSKGRYLSILNSDDIYTPNRFEVLLDFAQQEKADCLFTDVIPISSTGEVFRDPAFGWNQWHQRNRAMYFKHQDLYAGFLHGNYMVTTSNLFMTREAFDRVGLFSSLRYLHDYDFIFRMLLQHPNTVHYIHDQALLYYRIHEKNTLAEAAIAGREQDLWVIENYLLAKLPEDYQLYAKIGSDRLRELENELHNVRSSLATVPSHPASLSQRIKQRLKQRLIRMLRT